ncbi:NAD(P)-dependent oxidoreductase [Clostridia bacterium OttesenSCG-928-F22]|nr:NAD(P)-dependent oxidoreductase [Clostridia bacterium OttesenSCG-928-F22]
MKKNILVTGAGGYIGRHVVASLLEAGADVTALDINTRQIDDRANRITADIFQPDEALFEALKGVDAIVHLAWTDGFVHNAPSHIANLQAHITFLERLVRDGVKQVAVMGSMHEVGYYEGAVDEHTPCNPRSMYGIAKNALRQALCVLQQTEKFTLQWLRGYYIIGDDYFNHSVFTKLIQAEEEGKAQFPFTSGLNQYDFISVLALAKQITLCVLQEEVNGIINCCTGKPVSLKDKVEEFIKSHGYNIKLAYGQYPDRAYDSPAIWGNNEKIQQVVKAAQTSGNPSLKGIADELAGL